jgi:hypothetical protein
MATTCPTRTAAVGGGAVWPWPGVHGWMTRKKIGLPRHAAASIREVVPARAGVVSTHAARASPETGGAHIGSVGLNAAKSKPAASNRAGQSTAGAGCSSGGSTSGGSASNRRRRPLELSHTRCWPGSWPDGSSMSTRPLARPVPKYSCADR